MRDQIKRDITCLKTSTKERSLFLIMLRAIRSENWATPTPLGCRRNPSLIWSRKKQPVKYLSPDVAAPFFAAVLVGRNMPVKFPEEESPGDDDLGLAARLSFKLNPQPFILSRRCSAATLKTWQREINQGLAELSGWRRLSLHPQTLSNVSSSHPRYLTPVGSKWLRDGFKTQPPVDQRFRPVPAGFYCSKQWQPPRTGQNRRSTGGWVLKLPLMTSAPGVLLIAQPPKGVVGALGVRRPTNPTAFLFWDRGRDKELSDIEAMAWDGLGLSNAELAAQGTWLLLEANDLWHRHLVYSWSPSPRRSGGGLWE